MDDWIGLYTRLIVVPARLVPALSCTGTPYLENKVLGCWCESGCHGEVLIKLYHEYKNETKE